MLWFVKSTLCCWKLGSDLPFSSLRIPLTFAVFLEQFCGSEVLPVPWDLTPISQQPELPESSAGVYVSVGGKNPLRTFEPILDLSSHLQITVFPLILFFNTNKKRANGRGGIFFFLCDIHVCYTTTKFFREPWC